MNETLTLILVGAAGAALGAIFFGGLWWTVRKGVSSPRPALWFFGSMVVRMTIVLAGFYLVGRGHWERLVACLLGFIIARFIVMRLTRTPIERQHSPAKEAHPLTASICSLSSPKGGEGRPSSVAALRRVEGEEAQLFPAQIPSPRSGGERETEMVSRCAPAKEVNHAS